LQTFIESRGYDTFIKKTEKISLKEVLTLFFNSADGFLLVARNTSTLLPLSVSLFKKVKPNLEFTDRRRGEIFIFSYWSFFHSI